MATLIQDVIPTSMIQASGISSVITDLEPKETPVHTQLHLSLQDLHSVAADIKNTLSAAIADLCIDICSITARVQIIENSTAQQEKSIHKITNKMNIQMLQLRDHHRHLEDLENRGRRHNLRIRGLTESIDSDQLSTSVTKLFNYLLDRPLLMPINMERIHRALRTKEKDSDPPRDVICCLTDYKLKENILRSARIKSHFYT